MQAIQTRFIGPSNTKPARIKAWCSAGQIVLSVHTIPENINKHRFAASALCFKLGWISTRGAAFSAGLVNGSLPNGDEVFVFDVPAARE